MKVQSAGDCAGLLPRHICAKTFKSVVEAYARVRQSEPTGASNIYFDDGERGSSRLNAVSIEYACDVELATNHVLQGRPDLKKLWATIVAGQAFPNSDDAEAVLRMCGDVYARRGLLPIRYFQRIRRGRPLRRPIA